MIVGTLCDTCGAPFFRKLSDQALYCSYACMGRSQAKRWRQSDAPERFWKWVCPEPNSGCWLWTGTVGTAGYGQVGWMGERWLAHRLAWTLVNGPMQEGLVLCHRCDTPACVNPDHLFPGTQADNMQDCSRKGRMGARTLRGERVGTAKLTAAKVREIREFGAAKMKQRDIAARVGVSQMQVWRVLRFKVWRHVLEGAP